MRAYTLNTYGPDGMTLTDVAQPQVGPGQVKVRVEQIAVNPLDWKIRNGYLAEMLPLPLPVVIGSDIAGTVLEVGDGVDDLTAGDPVAGFADSGAFAAVAVTRRERLTKLPGGLDPRLAAALVTSAETAQRVIGLLDPAPASTLVVNGAAGAVGSAVTQLLVAAGHRVIGTASTANHDYLRRLGAVPAGYGDTMPAELRTAAPDGIDGAVDTAGQDFVARVDGLVRADRIVTIVDFAAGARGAIAKAAPSHDTA
ncbi:NADP-dependent oxidoreductase [Streptomyces hyderabadensis]|uniref:NADP-dependent oxidoreductase n=1 Tax=Streptomyces hyderabadensis TaxID=598549 RepID=UPI001CF078B0|nr:NADP-dependent oxidoreductase [Streptomyces hyderabadensis]